MSLFFYHKSHFPWILSLLFIVTGWQLWYNPREVYEQAPELLEKSSVPIQLQNMRLKNYLYH